MMPPKTKKLAGASATRRTTRGTKTTAANTVVPAPPLDGLETVPEEVVKAEEGKADPVAEEVAVEDKPPMDGHDKATDLNVKPMEEPRNDRHGLVLEKKEDEVKDPVDEYERGERLDFEDNEVEYEPEEYVGVDYDEKDQDQEDAQEDGYEYVEEVEEDVVEEEGGDTGEEDMDNVHEIELEGEEEDEDAVEAEQTDFVEAAEEDDRHEVVKERRRRKEFEVFVGGLDKDATEEDLKKVFSAVGEVTEVRLMRNSQTRKNKGFAFLRFATVEQAKRAVIELKNPVVNGKKCGATPSQDNDTLFLGNICKTWTKEALEKKLKHYGVENTEYISLAEDSNYPGLNRGFAFLEFASRSDAMDAFRRLQKGGVLFGVERSARVSFADSFVDSGDDIMAQVKTIFVDGIPASWDEDRVRELLNKYGKIEKIELARNMPSARRKDYGFVSFDTHDAAVSCARSINNAELGEGDNKVKVRARLSRPLQRGKGKHIPHGRSIPSCPSRAPWTRPLPRPLPGRGTRKVGSRIPPVSDRGLKRPSGFRDNRRTTIAAPLHRAIPPPHRAMAPPHRSRPLPPPHPPASRSYDRRAPVPVYPKGGSMKRDYPRREEIPPPKRRAAAADYDSRRTYRDEYSTHSSYSEMSRSSSATHAAAPRRAYQEDAYDPRYDRRTPSYREGRAREYDSLSGSKRPYSSLDDVPPRYDDDGVPQSRAPLDYDMAGGSSQYGDAYNDRVGRSSLGYGSGRSTMSSQDTHGLYGSRQNMGYGGGGAYGSSNVGGGAYSSSFASGDYVSRGSDVGGSSYPSMYSSRGLGNNGYTGRSGSGSYY